MHTLQTESRTSLILIKTSPSSSLPLKTMASKALIISLLPFLSFASLCHSSPRFVRPLQQQSLKGDDGDIFETRYFTQTLDHFDFTPRSYTTFQQRYLVNDTFWAGPKAPIFIYMGNEGDIELFARNTGFMWENAPMFKALLVFIEHRYYGKSIPFGSTEMAYSNASTLGYLSSTQALADYATLIIDLKKNMSADESPVFVFGGSYGGMLAAWFRLKYPHVAMGALASSSPILQLDGLVSPYTFNNIITMDYRSESESCYGVLKGSWKEIKKIGDQHEGNEKLEKSLKICKGQGVAYAVTNWMKNALVYAAMTDYPTPSNFLTDLPAYPVKQMCEAIDNPTTGNDVLSRLYGAMNIYYNSTGKLTCFNLDSSSSDLGLSGWEWQYCTEMFFATDGNSKESIFPANTYNYTANALGCEYTYDVVPRPHWITAEYGGHDIKRVLKRFGSNIIFYNGLRDPWSGGGVLESISESLIAIVAPQGAHHVDLRFSTKEDPGWLKNLRRKEIRIIKRWLKQFYEDSMPL